jgi:hypothetical protein
MSWAQIHLYLLKENYIYTTLTILAINKAWLSVSSNNDVVLNIVILGLQQLQQKHFELRWEGAE